jgi:transposase
MHLVDGLGRSAAISLSRDGSALGAFYRRLCARMDKLSANTATAHKLARMVYFMLTRGDAEGKLTSYR